MVAAPRSFLEAFGHLRSTAAFETTAPARQVLLGPPQAQTCVAAGGAAAARPRGPTTDAPRRAAPPANPRQHISAALAHARAKTVMLASEVQRKNPMLRFVQAIRVEYSSDIPADFVCGATTGVLFLSLQFHRQGKGYVYDRVRGIGKEYRLRVLLVIDDVEDGKADMAELTRLALAAGMTMICCGSLREAARYCETLRSYDEKTADGIQERVGTTHGAQLHAALTAVRGVNKNDVATLAFTFGSAAEVARASKEELRACPGMGETKVGRLYAAMNMPFKSADPWDDGKIDEDGD